MEWLQGFTDVCVPGPTCKIDWETWAVIATVLLGLLAWRNGRKATEIADRAAQIADVQSTEIVSARLASGRVVARVLLLEVGILPGRAIDLLNVTCQSQPQPNRADLPGGSTFKQTLEDASIDFLPGATELVDRIHTLPTEIGDSLAVVMAYARAVNISAKKMRSRLRPMSNQGHWYYAGEDEDFESLKTSCRVLAEAAMDLYGSFQAYVGVPASDFSSPAFGLDLSNLKGENAAHLEEPAPDRA